MVKNIKEKTRFFKSVDTEKNLTVGNDLKIKDDVKIDDKLTVKGRTKLYSTLSVHGTTVLASDLSVGGLADITSTLSVGGATVLASTLSVSGTSTLTGLTTSHRKVVTLSATASISQADSGSIFTLDNTTNTQIYTLPAASSSTGFWGTFYLGVDATTNTLTIVTNSSENTLVGTIVDGAGTSSSHTAGDTITFAAGAVVGDWVELCCNGTNFLVKGNCDAAGGITLTQASA